MSLTFKLIRGLTRVVVYVFFGEVDTVGMENLSKHGPVILVGNHKNQFVDALMVVALVQRPVSFLIAEKSMHRPLIGDFARAMHGIPVVRAADQARSLGPDAKIVAYNPETNVITCTEQCQFTTSGLQLSESLVIKNSGLAPLQVVKILSNTELVIKSPVKGDDEPDAGTPTTWELAEPVGFKILPKIDQTAMFSKTFDALKTGGCICLFPEGGSSDRTDLLPLKIGVSVMALGAAAQGTPVTVVPFGLNYNQAGAFRSRVLVDVGTPIRVPEHILQDYQAGKKRETYGQFLRMVETGLRSVTLNAPDQQTLRILRCMRRMYQGDVALEPKRFMELNRKFVLAFQKFRDNEGFLRLVDSIDEYLERVAKLHIKDSQVAALPPMGSISASGAAFVKLVVDTMVFAFMCLVALPAYLVFAPMLLRIHYVVQKEVEKALAGSSVKVKAHDVVASQKIMGAVIWIPITIVGWTVVMVVVGALLEYLLPGNPHTANLIWILPVAFFIGICPYTYLAIRAMDVANRSKRRLPSHWLVGRSIFRKEVNSTAGRLRLQRKRLVLEVQEFFEFVVVPQMEEWRVDPIVKRQTIVDRRRPSEVKNALEISMTIREKDFEAQQQEQQQNDGDEAAAAALSKRKSFIREAMKNVEHEAVGNAFEQSSPVENHDHQ